MQFGTLTLKRCKYGWMLFSGPYIGKCFDLYGQYSESEVAMMRNFLREGSIAIDVGANIGISHSRFPKWSARPDEFMQSSPIHKPSKSSAATLR